MPLTGAVGFILTLQADLYLWTTTPASCHSGATELSGQMGMDSQSKLTFFLTLLETQCVQLLSFLFRNRGSLSWGTSGFQTVWEAGRGPAVLAEGRHCLTEAKCDGPAFSAEQHIWIENRKKIHNLYVTRNSWTKNKFYFYVIFTQLENSKNEMVKS